MKNYKKGIKRRKTLQAPLRHNPEFGAGREYLFAIGRRKEASAMVRLYKNGKGDLAVNGLAIEKYFPQVAEQEMIKSPLLAVGQNDKVDVSAIVRGGGKRGQSESVKLAVARALLLLNPMFRANLRKSGFLTRDSRRKERKKPGLRRARRSPQWAKR